MCVDFRVIDTYKEKTSGGCHVTQHRSADEYIYKNIMTDCSNYVGESKENLKIVIKI